MSWGYHLIINAHNCDPESIRSKKNIENFAKDLVSTIDMVAYGKPQVIHFGEEEKLGYTLVQLIETSNICAHFAEETNNMYLDVFSCKPYDNDLVFAKVNEYFKPGDFNWNFLERD